MDKSMLAKTVGKNYNEITTAKPGIGGMLLGEGDKYGSLISGYNLPDGTKVMRHMKKSTASSSSISTNLLPVSYGSNDIAYQLFYFRVGQDGVIRDWASGYYNGASQGCLGILGVSAACGNEKNTLPVEKFDSIVVTSENTPLSSWQ